MTPSHLRTNSAEGPYGWIMTQSNGFGCHTYIRVSPRLRNAAACNRLDCKCFNRLSGVSLSVYAVRTYPCTSVAKFRVSCAKPQNRSELSPIPLVTYLDLYGVTLIGGM
jgi:hypothetical protein